jgi:signal transduction histidine kinase
VWKLLLPFLVLEIAIGYLGAALLVSHLSNEARSRIDSDLATRYFEARSLIHDSQSSLAEAADLAANLDGMSTAVMHRQSRQVASLAGSVLALKSQLQLLAVIRDDGVGLVDLRRAAGGAAVRLTHATPWSTLPIVSQGLAATADVVHPALADVDGAAYLLLAEPVCQSRNGCRPAGVVVVGTPLSVLVRAALGSSPNGRVSLGVFDRTAAVVASAGRRRSWATPPAAARSATARSATVRSDRNGDAVIYGPFDVLGADLGSVAIAEPTGPAVAAARRTGLGLDILLLVAVVGTLAIGGLVTNGLLRRIRGIQHTLRDLGSGDLSSRADTRVGDEVGDLADGVNRMAEQLDASYQTLELRVEERTEEVRRLLAQRTEFFAGLSHELRTPLAIIMAQAELLGAAKAGGRSRSGPGRAATIVRQSAEQLLGTVNDILDVARAETGSLELHLEAVDVAEVVENVRQAIAGLSQAAQVALHVALPTRLPTVHADRKALRQIVLNLVDNAVKYTPADGRVTVTATADADSVRLSVADTGVGMENPTEDIFEPFHRATGVRTQHGEASSGLGLALSRALARAQGGDITFTSSPGVGSTFVISLPAVRARRRHREPAP